MEKLMGDACHKHMALDKNLHKFSKWGVTKWAQRSEYHIPATEIMSAPGNLIGSPERASFPLRKKTCFVTPSFIAYSLKLLRTTDNGGVFTSKTRLSWVIRGGINERSWKGARLPHTNLGEFLCENRCTIYEKS